MRKIILFGALMLNASVAVAGEQSQVRASNGIILDVFSDSFANRYEYTAPKIDFKEDGASANSFALVAAIKKAGVPGAPMIVGNVYYRGEWHRYESAIFKGGDPVDFKNTSRDVVSCRYGCSFNEGFEIKLTPAQIAKHAENGVVQIQLRALSSNTAILSVPIAYIDAVSEASR